MKGARQASVTATRPLKSAVPEAPRPQSREYFAPRGQMCSRRPDSSPDRLRSTSPSQSRLQEHAGSPAPAKRGKRPDSVVKGQKLKRTLADIGKVDLKRGNFSNKQIVAPAKGGSLNVSLMDISPGKQESRTPSPTVSRSVRFQQLSKGFKVTKTALMQGPASQRVQPSPVPL